MHDYPDLMDDSTTQDSDDGFKMEDNKVITSQDKRKYFSLSCRIRSFYLRKVQNPSK